MLCRSSHFACLLSCLSLDAGFVQYLRCGVWHSAYTALQVNGPNAICELPVVICNKMAQNELDFVGGEESSWAGVLSVAEGDVVGASSDELPFGLVTGDLAALVEAVAIEHLWVLVDFWVSQAGGRDTNVGSFGEDSSVGEGKGGFDDTVNRDNGYRADSLTFLHETVHQLEFVQGCLAPSTTLLEHFLKFVPEERNVLWVIDEIVERIDEGKRSGVNRTERVI